MRGNQRDQGELAPAPIQLQQRVLTRKHDRADVVEGEREGVEAHPLEVAVRVCAHAARRAVDGDAPLRAPTEDLVESRGRRDAAQRRHRRRRAVGCARARLPRSRQRRAARLAALGHPAPAAHIDLLDVSVEVAADEDHPGLRERGAEGSSRDQKGVEREHEGA